MNQSEWKAREPDLIDAGQIVVQTLRTIAARQRSTHGVVPWTIETRVKEWQSIEAKIERKKKVDPIYAFERITDLVGVRVVVESAGSARALAHYLRCHAVFEIVDGRSEDFSTTPRQDGYRGIHLMLLVEGRLPPKLKYSVELQIRTILQHQWSILSYSEFYKKLSEIPPSLLARMRALSDILNCAEIESEELRCTRVLDECSVELREQLSTSVLERLDSAGIDPQVIGKAALKLLELERQVRRALVSDGDSRRRAYEAICELIKDPLLVDGNQGLAKSVENVAERVRAIVERIS